MWGKSKTRARCKQLAQGLCKRKKKKKSKQPEIETKREREQVDGAESIQDVSSPQWCKKWLHSSDLSLLTTFSNKDRQRRRQTGRRIKQRRIKNEGRCKGRAMKKLGEKKSGRSMRRREFNEDAARPPLPPKKQPTFIGIPGQSPMQHSKISAVWMAFGASRAPPAVSATARPGCRNLGHPFKNPPVSLTGNQKTTAWREQKTGVTSPGFSLSEQGHRFF